MTTEERWRESFGKFEATFARLRDALEADGELSEIERGGVIHCFTSTWFAMLNDRNRTPHTYDASSDTIGGRAGEGMEPSVGFEPTTYALRMRRSAS